MDQRDFKKLTEKIGGLWGESAASEEKSNALWPYCRGIPLGEAVMIIDAMIDDGEKFFLPAVFASRAMASSKERALKATMATRERVRVDGCQYCHGGGQLVAYNRADPGCCGLAFRCTFCGAAKALGLSDRIFPWLREYGSDYELMRDRLLSTATKLEIVAADG